MKGSGYNLECLSAWEEAETTGWLLHSIQKHGIKRSVLLQ